MSERHVLSYWAKQDGMSLSTARQKHWHAGSPGIQTEGGKAYWLTWEEWINVKSTPVRKALLVGHNTRPV